MPLKIGNTCPLLAKKCIETKCAWYTQVAGFDTNTGKQVDEFGCAVAWLPMLLIENSGQQRQTGAAVESFRNEMVKSNEKSQKILLAAAQMSNNPNVINVIEEKPKRLGRSKKTKNTDVDTIG